MSFSKKVKVAFALGIFFVVWSFLWKLTVSDIKRDMYQTLDTGEYSELCEYSIQEQDELKQFFQSRETVYAIDLYIKNATGFKKNMDICIVNETDGAVIFQDSIEIKEDKTRIIVKDKKYHGATNDYSITIKAKYPGTKIILTKEDLYNKGDFYINDINMGQDIVLKVFAEAQNKSPFWLMYLGYTVIILTALYLVWCTKWRLEKQCAFLVIVIGLLYVFQFPPQTIHDEDRHIDVVYRMSNMLMGKGYSNEDGSMSIRENDLEIYQLVNRNSLHNHQYVRDNFELFDSSEREISIQGKTLTHNFLLYLPQVLGFTLARFLQLGCFPALYLAKIFGVLFFAGCVYYAVKNTPIAKVVFAVAALLPMTLQQTIGITYDSVLNGVAFVVIAMCLRAVYGEHLYKKDWLKIAIFTIWLAMFKRGVYVFIALLLSLFVLKNKKRISRKVTAAAVAGGSVLGAGVLYINRGILVDLLSNTTSAGRYSYSMLLYQPIEFISLLWRTVYQQGSIYIETMLGARLAWNEIAINGIVIAGFGLLLLLSIVHVDGEQKIINGVDKIVIVFIAMLVFGAVELAALGWTDIGAECIWGVQGRYFIPILPMILLLLDNFKISFRRNQSKSILMMTGFLHIFVLFDINRFILHN